MSNLDEKTIDIKTYCKNCIFKARNDFCLLDRLQRFKELQTPIDYDKDGNPIIGRICNTCRDKDWAKQHRDAPLPMIALEEAQIHLDIILTDYDNNDLGYHTNLCSILDSVYDISFWNIKPKRIIISTKYDSLRKNINKLYKRLQLMFNQSGIEIIIVANINETDPIKSALSKVDSTFYSVYNMGETIPLDFIDLLDNYLNRGLFQFVLIEKNQTGYHSVVQTKISKMFGVNENMPIEQKIHEAAEFQNNTNLIHTWEDVWNYQKLLS